MSKVTVVGAGNVGAACADVLAYREVCTDIILLDVRDGFAEGKALDLLHKAPIENIDSRTYGVTNDYSRTAGSDIVVITSGFPRKPGMSRDDLITLNANIVKTVTEEILKYSPDAIVIVVTNPLDVMTYAAHKFSGKSRFKVFGMAGILDTARFRAHLAQELNISPKDIQAMLMGGHGDTMVPLPRYTTVSGIPVTELLSKDKIDAILERTKFSGGEVLGLMGTSAYFSTGSAAAQMVEAILRDQKRIFPVCVKLEGEFGIHDGTYIGVPVVLDRTGINRIVNVNLNDEERGLLDVSRQHVRNIMDVFDRLFPNA